MSFTRKSTLTIALSILALLFSTQCSDNRATFEELENNRLFVIFKGTYESNNPQPWNVPADLYDPVAGVQDDSVDDFFDSSQLDPASEGDEFPTAFMVDIAEMRLVDTGGEQHKFSNYRQTLVFNVNNDSDILFNGTGYLMENDDVEGKVYVAVLIYLRKIVLNKAKKYSTGEGGWKLNETLRTIFAEKTLYGFPVLPGYDFVQHLIYSHYDRIRLESTYLNRVFPVLVPIAKPYVKYSSSLDSAVLEIRFVLKNFIKKYEVDGYDALGSMTTTHFYSLSDWLYDVRERENDIGGNLLTTARMYVPGYTGSVVGTNFTGSDSYVIAVPSDPSFTDVNEYVKNFTIPDENSAKYTPGGGLSVTETVDEGFSLYTLSVAGDPIADGVVPGDTIEMISTSTTFPEQYYIVNTVDAASITFKAEEGLGNDGDVSYQVWPVNRREANPCDFAVQPRRLGSGIESLLDYYAKFEYYRYQYNQKEKGCQNLDQYKSQWTNYADELAPKNFAIPPNATYVPAGNSYIISNITAPGSYEIFSAPAPSYGTLFYDNDFTHQGTVKVPVGGSETVDCY